MGPGKMDVKILFVTHPDPNQQGDLLEVGILHGLRSLMGQDCVDIPRKKVMYHDWSDTPKESLHGRGFSLYTEPIMDVDRDGIDKVDYVLYGNINIEPNEKINSLAKKAIYFLDGHDLYGNASRIIEYGGERVIGLQRVPCFKRELVEDNEYAHPIGFGIPEYQIRPIDLEKKTQTYQKTAPDDSLFRNVTDLGGSRHHHKFTVEEEYYDDLSSSWFGLTCKKGGWDCLRHYEIMAAGSLLLFKDYDKKPPMCSPVNLPCFSYSTQEELDELTCRLVVDNKPTREYNEMLNRQRRWLISSGTTISRAKQILEVIDEPN